jgi:hypothetical protein
VYEGKVEPFTMSDNCTDNVPVLLRRATFCSAFAADARDFRSYNSWVRHLHNLLQHVVRMQQGACYALGMPSNARSAVPVCHH